MMNHEEQIEKLTPEAKAFYAHQLRGGSDHELVERRAALQTGLVNRTLYGNHRAAVFAVADLNRMIDPPPDPDEVQEKMDDGFIQTAQRLRDAGDDAGARLVMESGGLDISDLAPRRANADIEKREEKARKEFQIRRDAAINKLQIERDWSKREATDFFHGKGKYQPPENPLAPLKHQAPVSLADELKRQCNRNHSFPVDRPI